jgi:hypothetical protein
MQALLSRVPAQAGLGQKGCSTVLEAMCRYGDAKVRGTHTSQLKGFSMYATLTSTPSTRLVLFRNCLRWCVPCFREDSGGRRTRRGILPLCSG